MIRILIVEDDPNIAKMIETTVAIAGYQGKTCSEGDQAIDEILGRDYDLILLDIMLPGIDGFEIMRRVRGREIPVIFLTALQDVTDKVKGLRLGAEDYIVKPFEAMELLARIEVILRRCNKTAKVLRYEDIVVDLDRHSVQKDGENIPLTPKEFDTLVFLMQNVDIHVQQVRRKLGLQNKLVTIPKLGYRLESGA